ncbi:hypothetical protein ALC53_11555 [Atta colombica]|uniref:Uncharacterized protein n=1 Tax=Atta colombica TaxID=520822 RepID=A0A195B1C2_9HYME|nr:hypothetical protein ALC53_11555 [Atta colombica]
MGCGTKNDKKSGMEEGRTVKKTGNLEKEACHAVEYEKQQGFSSILRSYQDYPSRNGARTRISKMRDRKRDKIRPGRWSTALQRARFISLFNKDLVWNSRL